MDSPFWSCGDLERLAANDMHDGARELAAEPLPPAPRLSYKQLRALDYASRMLWRAEKDQAHRVKKLVGTCNGGVLGMRDALVLHELTKKATSGGGIVR